MACANPMSEGTTLRMQTSFCWLAAPPDPGLEPASLASMKLMAAASQEQGCSADVCSSVQLSGAKVAEVQALTQRVKNAI